MLISLDMYPLQFAGSVGARQVGLKVSAQTNYAPTCLALAFGEETLTFICPLVGNQSNCSLTTVHCLLFL